MRALLLVMIVAATLPMAFVRPIIGLILWIGFSYMNPHRIAYGFATAYPWVMIVAVVTLISITVNIRQRQAMPFMPITVLLVAFLVWTGISTLVAVQFDMAQAKWIEFFKIQMMTFATLILVTDRQRLHWVLWAIVLSFGFWGTKGGAFTILSGGGYHVLGPIKSFFRDNNGFALVMCMSLPLMRYLLLQETRKWYRIGLWVMMGLTTVSIIGTYSRGGFLALAAVAFMLLLKSRRRAGLIVVAVMLAVAMGAFLPDKWFGRIDTIDNYQEDASVQGRFDSWNFATHVALAHPLTGGGFDVWASDSMWNRYGPPGAHHRAIHSIFFEVLGEHGFVGLGLFMGLIAVGWMTLARICKQSRAGPDLHWMGDLASMLQVSLVGFVAAGAFLPMPYFDLFYQLLAVTVLLQLFMKRALASSRADIGEGLAARPSTAAPAQISEAGAEAEGTRRPLGTVREHGLPRW